MKYSSSIKSGCSLNLEPVAIYHSFGSNSLFFLVVIVFQEEKQFSFMGVIVTRNLELP